MSASYFPVVDVDAKAWGPVKEPFICSLCGFNLDFAK